MPKINKRSEEELCIHNPSVDCECRECNKCGWNPDVDKERKKENGGNNK